MENKPTYPHFSASSNNNKQKIWYSRLAIWIFVVSLVCLHVERHIAFRAFEAGLVPRLKNTIKTINYLIIHQNSEIKQ